MNNSVALKSIAMSYNTLYKNTKVFDEIRETLDNKQNKQAGELFTKDQVQQIEKAYNARRMELDRFGRELDKFEKFMPPSMYNNLKKAISDELFVINGLLGNVNGYLELGTDDFLERISDQFDAEKEIGVRLGKEMEIFTNNLAFNLFMQAKLGHLTLEDLKLMALAFESDSILFDKINNVIAMMEDEDLLKNIPPALAQRLGIESPADKKDAPQPVAAPVEATDKKEGVAEASVDTVAPAVAAQGKGGMQPIEKPAAAKKPTLQEKLSVVNYKLNGNINTEVQEITVEDRLETISAEIERLKGKEKRTIADNFRLSQLIEEELELKAYQSEIGQQKLSRSEQRRERNLKSTSDRLTATEKELADAKEMSEQYQSRVMRFFSARYQQTLSKRIKGLQSKQGELTDLQKMSSVARFDKQSRKIARRARRKGNIAQLKAYRDQILEELELLGNDMERFSSITVEKMQQMRGRTIVCLDQNKPLLLGQPALVRTV